MSGKIQDFIKYKGCLAELEGLYSKSQAETSQTNIKTLLKGYCEFTTKNWVHSYPLLLSNGEPLSLNRTPSHIYLLPPIDSLPKDERLILCQFTKEAGNKQSFRIIHWNIAKSENENQRLAEKDSPFWEIEEKQEVSFADRINEIKFSSEDGIYTLRLYFDNFILRITFFIDNKQSMQSLWIEQADIKERTTYWHRSSFNEMSSLLRVEVCEDEQHWQDDALFLVDDEKRLPYRLGYINGADAPQNSDYIYIANNEALICAFNKENLIESNRFSSICHDVLSVPHTNDEKIDTILAPCDDGTVWLVENRKNKLETLHYQLTPEKITRVLGFGENQIITLNRLNQLVPMRVNKVGIDSQKIYQIRDFLWQEVYALEKYNETWNDITYRDQLAKLALSQYSKYFLHSDLHANILSVEELYWIELLFLHINQYNTIEKKENNFYIHEHLLERIWRAFRSHLYMLPDKSSMETIQLSNTYWDPLWTLFQCDKNAPDALWLNLFRHHDWLGLFIDKLSEKEVLTKINEKAEEFFLLIAEKRKQLNAIYAEYRPMEVASSKRLISPARHIREFDNKNNLICYTNYKEGLYITKTPTIDKTLWQDIIILKHRKYWQGLPRTIVTGERLQSLFPNLENPIFIATNRGELRLFETKQIENKININLVSKLDCPIEARVCHPVKQGNNHIGLMLGGKNIKRQAVILWIYFSINSKTNKIKINIKQLWKDKRKGGILRMLNVVGAPHQPKILLATDSDLGLLHLWSLSFKNKSNRLEPVINDNYHRCFLNEQTGLSALAINNYNDPRYLVTGGKNGIAMAYKYTPPIIRPFFDNNKLPELTPDWVMRCGKNLSRAIYIQSGLNKEKKHFWLLCSDNADLQILNADTGRLETVIEHIGGVTAARHYNNDHNAVIGTTRGRLMQLSLSQKSNLKSNKPINLSAELVLKTANPETLALMAISLKTINENKEPKWFSKLSPTVIALCLKEFRLKNNNKAINHLIQIAWDNIPSKEYKTTPTSRLLWIMMHFAESWQLDNPTSVFNKDEEDIYQQLLKCLWTVDFEKTEDCPLLNDRARLRIIKLGQAFRLINTNNIKHIHQELSAQEVNQWLVNLSKMWQFSNLEKQPEIDYLVTQLRILLSEKVPILSLKWQTYLNNLVKNNYNKKDIPSILRKLWPKPKIKPFNDNDLKLLKTLFKSKSWVNWLTELQAILSQLEKETKVQPHIAWQEKARLYQLEDHFIDSGTKKFIDYKINSLPLIALFWKNLTDYWIKFIKQQLQDLDKKSINNEYLYINTNIKWQDTNTTILELDIHNNGTVNITIASFKYNSDTGENNESNNMIGTIIGTVEAGVQRELVLKTNTNNQVNGILNIVFTNEYSKKEKEIKININNTRGISLLKETEGYFDTDAYLIKILTTPNKYIYWLDGDFWTDDERRTFFNEAKQIKYSTVILDKIPRLGQSVFKSKASIFCPDLPLSHQDPSEFVRRFHVLLHHIDFNSFSILALSFWHWAKPLPSHVDKALSKKQQLLTTIECEELLNRLFNYNQKILNLLKEGIKLLSDNILGTWCSSEPINNSPKMYLDNVSALDLNIWQTLIENKIWDWPRNLDFNERILIQELLQYYQSKQDISDKLSQALMRPLGSVIKHHSGLWKIMQTVFVLETEYKSCWLIPKGITPNQKSFIKANDNSLFLQLDNERRASVSEHTLNLNFLQCLRLLFLDKNKQYSNQIKGENITHELLSEWAALTTNIEAHKIFQTSNGMATGTEIRHFVGRNETISEINTLLNNADNNKTGFKGAVILGCRRIGKTSLRQYLVKSLKEKRLILDLNCPIWVGQFNNANIIEQNFFRACQQAINTKYDHHNLFTFSWQYSDNIQQKTETREQFKQYLINHKKNRKKAILLIFDETDMLLQGRPHLENFFLWLRGLMSEGYLAWIATGFPRGHSIPDCLHAQLMNSASPFYNTMQLITLKPWDKSISWHFLRSRLALLGIRLPTEYCNKVWAVSQGLPWVIHRMGELFAAYQNSGCRTLITLSQATFVLDETKKEVLASFDSTIENAAKDIEGKYNQKNEDSFADNRLVLALKNLALKRATEPESPFSLSEIHNTLNNQGDREILKEILDTMTHLSIISSLTTKKEYQFSSGIYPRFFSDTGKK